MHPMLMSALADQIVRERSSGRGVNALSRPFASRGLVRGSRPKRRGGLRLAPRPRVVWRAS